MKRKTTKKTKKRIWKSIHLEPAHPKQKKIVASGARYKVVACGRRFGKTEVGKREMAYALCEGLRCWWLSPTYPMASQVWRDFKYACRDIKGVVIHEHERRMEFPGGGVLEIRSTFYADHLRGAGLDFVVLDEAAFMEPHVWPEIILPMLLERRGKAIFLSSPNGKNWFWEIYQLGLNL